MKLFWRINYVITLYTTLVVLPFVIYTATNTSYIHNKFVKIMHQILTFDNMLMYPSFVIESLQIPIGCLAILFIKNQRHKKNYIYLSILSVLLILKFFTWLIMAMGFSDYGNNTAGIYHLPWDTVVKFK